jgi:hypothetical protein
MAYILDIDERTADYLANLPLSNHGRGQLAYILEQLELLPDSFRNDPANRLTSGDPYLNLIWWFQEEDGSRHAVRFILDDSGAAYGVLRILFAEFDPS